MAVARHGAPSGCTGSAALWSRCIECGGKGDCQWCSLIHELRVKKLGNFSVPQLRAIVSSWLEANTELMDGFIVTDEFPSWADYCLRIRDAKFHTWGDNLVLIAVCAIFNVQILLTSITKEHDKVLPTEDGVFEAKLHLGHIPEEHYFAMTPSSDTAQTVLNNYL